MIALVGEVLTPETRLSPGVVLVEGDHIRAVGSPQAVSVPREAERISVPPGSVIAPGMIDLHTHGLYGHDVMGRGLAEAIEHYPRHGVTSFMATTLTLPEERIRASLKSMAKVLAAPPEGARCLGIHLEGPHLSPARPGMATAAWFRPLTWDHFESLQQVAEGWIRMITFAPEEGGAMEVIPRLVESGVTPVIGHSDATFAQVAQAVSLGLNHATHTFNAMRPLHHREPGVVGAVLYFDEIYAQFIADGVHLHPVTIALLLKLKGLERAVLISDSAPLAGLPEGVYTWEDKRILVRQGRCTLEDGTIAGAHALLDTGLRTLVREVGLDLAEALKVATVTPAAAIGLQRKGRLAPGFDADIIVLDENLSVTWSMVEGQVVWEGRGVAAESQRKEEAGR